jgi:L-fucose mutarotase
MLKGISKYLSPELISALCRMGHGDEIVLADAHFPGHSMGPQVIRADGITVTQLLEGIMPLFELDTYAHPLIMMEYVPGDEPDPSVEQDYLQVVRRHTPAAPSPLRIERHAFYERAHRAFAIVMTGELRKYGNLILKKGVIPVQ